MEKSRQKEAQNSRNQGFSYFFVWMLIEGAGTMRFGLIRILRIRIHNTGYLTPILRLNLSQKDASDNTMCIKSSFALTWFRL